MVFALSTLINWIFIKIQIFADECVRISYHNGTSDSVQYNCIALNTIANWLFYTFSSSFFPLPLWIRNGFNKHVYKIGFKLSRTDLPMRMYVNCIYFASTTCYVHYQLVLLRCHKNSVWRQNFFLYISILSSDAPECDYTSFHHRSVEMKIDYSTSTWHVWQLVWVIYIVIWSFLFEY